MSEQGKSIGVMAVGIAAEGENKSVRKFKTRIDYKIFGHFIGIWMITGVVVFASLLIITTIEGSTNVFRDTIKEVDMLSMSFSLVLSAFLEQVWSFDASKGTLYSITLGFEGVVVLVGVMLYMAYSILGIVAPENELLEMMFGLNLAYVLASSISVVLGFLSRAIIARR